MKKIIITVMTIIMTMSLVSCKDEPLVPATLEANEIETVTTENIETETVIVEDRVYEDEIHEDKIEEDEFSELKRRYEAGEISKEYYEEYMYNSQENNW